MADEDYPTIPDSALESEEGFRAAMLICLNWSMKKQVALQKQVDKADARLRQLHLRVIALTAAIVIVAEGSERLLPIVLNLLGAN